jgi:hypothetical protein
MQNVAVVGFDRTFLDIFRNFNRKIPLLSMLDPCLIRIHWIHQRFKVRSKRNRKHVNCQRYENTSDRHHEKHYVVSLTFILVYLRASNLYIINAPL